MGSSRKRFKWSFTPQRTTITTTTTAPSACLLTGSTSASVGGWATKYDCIPSCHSEGHDWRHPPYSTRILFASAYNYTTVIKDSIGRDKTDATGDGTTATITSTTTRLTITRSRSVCVELPAEKKKRHSIQSAVITLSTTVSAGKSGRASVDQLFVAFAAIAAGNPSTNL